MKRNRGCSSPRHPDQQYSLIFTALHRSGQGPVAGGESSTTPGFQTTASGAQATSLGQSTTSGGFNSFAGGTVARANHDGTFVSAQYNCTDFAFTAMNQFLIRPAGGVGINTHNPNSPALALNGKTLQQTVAELKAAFAQLNVSRIPHATAR